jgi:hypothetical protein
LLDIREERVEEALEFAGSHLAERGEEDTQVSWRVTSSAVDPDPYVFGPPGSGSVIICTDPDPSINKQKK